MKNGKGTQGKGECGDSLSDSEAPPTSTSRGAPSAMTMKKMKNMELVMKKINEVKEQQLTKVDLSRMGLTTLPEELLENSQIQLLYLEGNELTKLPENFFDRLPMLRWLDLRRNYISSLPHTYIGRHQHLQNLLLEGNELKTLPLELGMVETLRGLNISNNPLEFPPQSIIDQGTRAVLNFMRDLLQAKSNGTYRPTLAKESSQETDDGQTESEAGTLEGEYQRLVRQMQHKVKAMSDTSFPTEDTSYSDTNSELVGPIPHPVSLHQPVSYNELKTAKAEKLKKFGALGTSDRKLSDREFMIDIDYQDLVQEKPRRKKKNKHALNKYPPPPPPDRVELRFLEERKLANLQYIKSKQDDIIQKRKEAEFLKEWRSDTRQLQQDKYREASLYGGAKVQVDVADNAPFGIDKGFMKIPTNEERIKMDIRKKHEELRKPVSPETRLRIEEERRARDIELERKIKEHMKSMAERRRQPKATPQEEMEAAKQDLQIAEKLQKEIETRRKVLEYRFTAFTGDRVGPTVRQHRY